MRGSYKKKGKPEIKVHVEGQLTFNGIYPYLNAARAGLGLAFIPQDLAEPYLQDGALETVLDEWCLSFPGFYLYYPSITQPSPAFSLFVEALRHKW